VHPGIDANLGDETSSPLHSAANAGFERIVEILLAAQAHGVDPNAADAHGATPLYLASSSTAPPFDTARCS